MLRGQRHDRRGYQPHRPKRSEPPVVPRAGLLRLGRAQRREQPETQHGAAAGDEEVLEDEGEDVVVAVGLGGELARLVGREECVGALLLGELDLHGAEDE